MQFKSVERGSDKRDQVVDISTVGHRTNRAHPLFCEVSSPQAASGLVKLTFGVSHERCVETD